MGERCVVPDGPAPLNRYNLSEICQWCKNAGLSPELGSAAEETATDLPEKRCTLCGKPDVELLDAWACEECAAEGRRSGFAWEPYASAPGDPPIEERFADLFKAARVLMEQDAPGDQVFPTLAFAGCVIGQNILGATDLRNRLVEAWGNPEAWKTGVDGFISKFPNARPVEVVDETLILEQEPASIEIIPYPQTDIPQLVEIHVYQRRRHTRLEEIVSRYEQKLSAARIAHNVADKRTPMSAESFEGHMVITVSNHKHDVPAAYARVVWRDEQPRFPRVENVREYCKFALTAFAPALNMRERKDRPNAVAKLAPPCVALILREVGGMKGRQSVQRLLDQHLSVEISDKSKENTLWEPINNPKLFYKVRQPLHAASDSFLFTR